MTLQRARELIEERSQGMSGYNRQALRVLLAEVGREHGWDVVDGLIREYDLEQRFEIRTGVPINL